MPKRFPLVALVILDGFGCAPPGPGNAVDLAATPVFDRLWREYPHTTIEASGEAAGLPKGQMGNSEVGHLTIGAGRRLYQDLMRVNRSIEDGSFFRNPALVQAFERGKRVHLMGLVSHGGVHSHMDHLQALLRFAPEKTWIHAFTDGRDVSPTSAVSDLALLPLDRVATVTGRYYAMDRDKRGERTRRAFDAIVHRRCSCTATAHDLLAEVQRNYDEGTTDEFLEPICVDGAPPLEAGDTAIFFNFRPDRGRQLTRMLLDHGFDVTTMTRYAADLATPVAFEEQEVDGTLAEVLAAHDLKQLHAAETEKYAHVTYFFNGGREEAWPGEERVLVPSPREVASYDLKPEMSADEVADAVVDQIGDGYAFCVVNFANPDMVGHTGKILAVIEACEAADRALGRVAQRVADLGGVCLVTADHGNAEKLLEDDGVSPHTAHTTSPVPLVVTDRGAELREGGEIADLAPTVLELLGIRQPPEMTGRSLVNRP
jgi:2,3-bisphosphoglycerate-independent phosphoglycerate mutase